MSEGFKNIKEIFNNRRQAGPKPPVYPWQDMALRIIKQLAIPPYKKSAIFKVCRDLPQSYILGCFSDTQELCKSGEKWRYFFKLIDQYKKISES
ncbi:MAG: hypothetical protein NTZ18_01990 [Candidatus Komeilibacteria bacterium]|nr:hypothetical protein [Candidatus Komeilibacteria bacterium]